MFLSNDENLNAAGQNNDSRKLILHILILEDLTIVQYNGIRTAWKRRLPMTELFTFLKGLIREDHSPEAKN